MKHILTYLILALCSAQAAAGNWLRDAEPTLLEVRYTRTQVTDTTMRDSRYFTEETMLRIGPSMSRFGSVPYYYRDSLMFCAPDLYWQMEAASFHKDPAEHGRTALQRSGRYWSTIYKNYPAGKLTETSYFDLTNWRYTEDWEQPEWDVCDESDEILGYQCFKATTRYRGRIWTAWFAPEIPFHDGPWKLCGLPGLILEAGDDTGEYHFIACGLMQSGRPDVGYLIHREKRGVTNVTRDQFFNNWWRYTNTDSSATIRAMYGVSSSSAPQESKSITHHDKEETDYPHDL